MEEQESKDRLRVFVQMIFNMINLTDSLTLERLINACEIIYKSNADLLTKNGAIKIQNGAIEIQNQLTKKATNVLDEIHATCKES